MVQAHELQQRLIGMGQSPSGIGQSPTGIGQSPSAMGQSPTAIGQSPTAMGQSPVGIGQSPTAMGQSPPPQSQAQQPSMGTMFNLNTPSLLNWAKEYVQQGGVPCRSHLANNNMAVGEVASRVSLGSSAGYNENIPRRHRPSESSFAVE